MARIVVMPQARRDVEDAIGTLELPADTWSRIAHSLRVVETFPRSGPKLEGQLAPNRYVLGAYRYDEASDLVFLLAVIDARSSISPLH